LVAARRAFVIFRACGLAMVLTFVDVDTLLATLVRFTFKRLHLVAVIARACPRQSRRKQVVAHTIRAPRRIVLTRINFLAGLARLIGAAVAGRAVALVFTGAIFFQALSLGVASQAGLCPTSCALVNIHTNLATARVRL
jgi:hypothetical protein